MCADIIKLNEGFYKASQKNFISACRAKAVRIDEAVGQLDLHESHRQFLINVDPTPNEKLWKIMEDLGLDDPRMTKEGSDAAAALIALRRKDDAIAWIEYLETCREKPTAEEMGGFPRFTTEIDLLKKIEEFPAFTAEKKGPLSVEMHTAIVNADHSWSAKLALDRSAELMRDIYKMDRALRGVRLQSASAPSVGEEDGNVFRFPRPKPSEA